MNEEYYKTMIKELKLRIEHLEYERDIKQKQIEQIRDMLYKRQLDDYDTYTANVVCDFQSDFEEILRGE